MYKKLILAFTSLTLATAITAYACDQSDEMSEENTNETAYQANDNYVPLETPEGNVICVRAHKREDSYNQEHTRPHHRNRHSHNHDHKLHNKHSSDHNDTSKTLGYLQPETVLPSPSVPYDYEKIRQKELDRKMHKHKHPAKKTSLSGKRSERKSKVNHDSTSEVMSNKSSETKSVNNSAAHMSSSDSSKMNSMPDTSVKMNTTPVSEPKVEVNKSVTSQEVPAVNMHSEVPVAEQLNIQSSSPQDAKMKPSMPAPVETSNAAMMSRMTTLEYQDSELEISSANQDILKHVTEDFKNNKTKVIKIQSYAYSKDSKPEDARRNAFQRAIKVRKFLIDQDIDPASISVNAVEDNDNKLNRVEISFEENKS